MKLAFHLACERGHAETVKYLHEVLSQSFLLYITVTVLAGQAEIAD